MSFVLDASVALAWSLPDEQDQRAKTVLNRCFESSAAVPAHWPTEVLNGLLIAERKSRISREVGDKLLLDFAALPITVHPASMADGELMALARQHRLTVYDAAYLQLARKLRVALATFDSALARAASDEGILLLV